MTETASRAYLDHAATTPMLPQARSAWLEASESLGNPSSLHASGRQSRRVIEESRERIAAALCARPSAVVFTAGGTEADNLAVKGLAWAKPGAQVVASAIEHHAVLDPVEWLAKQGTPVRWLMPDALGVTSAGAVAAALDGAESTALVSVMWANNEIGTIQPVFEIAALCRERGVPFHTDAVQALGQLPMDLGALGATAVTISGHKVGGPFGTGALILDPTASVTPVLHGGGQEREVRSGTLDAPGIAGLAVAVEHAVEHQAMHAADISAMRDALISGILQRIPEAVVNGALGQQRLPANVHVTFPGCEGDLLLMLLDAAGVDCSTGSACTAGIPEPSHVLLALGVDEAAARGSLRFSLGRTSTQADIDAVLQALPAAVDRASRAGSPSVRS